MCVYKYIYFLDSDRLDKPEKSPKTRRGFEESPTCSRESTFQTHNSQFQVPSLKGLSKETPAETVVDSISFNQENETHKRRSR